MREPPEDSPPRETLEVCRAKDPRSDACRCWFEKQPEGPSRRSVQGAGERRHARVERKSKGETLVSQRQDWPQFPLHPHSFPKSRPVNLPVMHRSTRRGMLLHSVDVAEEPGEPVEEAAEAVQTGHRFTTLSALVQPSTP